MILCLCGRHATGGETQVWYVGSWAIGKVLEKLRCFIKRNISSTNSHTLDKVNEPHLMRELLEEKLNKLPDLADVVNLYSKKLKSLEFLNCA